MPAGDPSLLLVVLDAVPAAWAAAQKAADDGAALGSRRATFQEVVQAMLEYTNAFSLLNRQNKLAVIASLPGGA